MTLGEVLTGREPFSYFYMQSNVFGQFVVCSMQMGKPFYENEIAEPWTSYFLIDGQIFSFCPDQHGGEAFNPNDATQTHSIFAKL